MLAKITDGTESSGVEFSELAVFPYRERSVTVAEKPKRILVVEPDPDKAESFRFALGGFETVVCVGATDAIELARKTSPAAVLANLHQPDLHGLEIVRMFREEFPDSAAFTLVYGTHSGGQSRNEVQSVWGVDRFLPYALGAAEMRLIIDEVFPAPRAERSTVSQVDSDSLGESEVISARVGGVDEEEPDWTGLLQSDANPETVKMLLTKEIDVAEVKRLLTTDIKLGALFKQESKLGRALRARLAASEARSEPQGNREREFWEVEDQPILSARSTAEPEEEENWSSLLKSDVSSESIRTLLTKDIDLKGVRSALRLGRKKDNG